MNISDVIANRRLDSLVHFTTNRGSLGILASGFLKSRQRLNIDEQLRHIFQPNATVRDRDSEWLDYVNLSITRINHSFFSASGNWHRDEDIWWCIFLLDSSLMTHEGVHFSTTNNMYSGVQRFQGGRGLENLFGDRIHLYSNRYANRERDAPENLTTCHQAEVLYPGQVSTEFLKEILVRCDEDGDEIAAQIDAVNHRKVKISVRPDMFGGIR